MRHGMAGNRLNRFSSLYKATVRDIAEATLIQERICTTKAKAKEARKLVDKLITLGKKGTLADRRRAFAILCDHGLVSQLFKETSPRFKNRVGGYTRIVSLGLRRGDNAQLAILELTEKKAIIVSKPKSEAVAKKQDSKTILPAKKESNQESEPQAGKKVSVSHEAKAGTVEDAEVKEQPSIKDAVKIEIKKPSQERVKKVKSFVGGLRKMFNRKVGGGQ